MKTVAVCGGDIRNLYLCRYLEKNNYRVRWLFAEKCVEGEKYSGADYIKNAYAVILPLPLSRDGETLNTPLSSEKISLSELDFSQVSYIFTSDNRTEGVNYFNDESLLTENARFTATGFLKELLIFEKSDILGKKALVTGFGRVAQAVCDILYRNGLYVSVAARNEAQRCKAGTMGYRAVTIEEGEKILPEFDYVINTVPKKLFSQEAIIKSEGGTAFFELAEKLVDNTYRLPSAYIECKGMPGKHLPESAGEAIGRFVCGKMRE